MVGFELVVSVIDGGVGIGWVFQFQYHDGQPVNI